MKITDEQARIALQLIQRIGQDLPSEDELISQGRDFAEAERTTAEVLAAIEARIQEARS